MTVTAQDNETREQVIKALLTANEHAKSQPYVIELFADEPPTAWTKAHRYLNRLLTDYESCG